MRRGCGVRRDEEEESMEDKAEGGAEGMRARQGGGREDRRVRWSEGRGR
jgi:hypothetical protein